MKLFGCDYIKSINALGQMRGIAIEVEGDKLVLKDTPIRVQAATHKGMAPLRILSGFRIKTCSENKLQSK